MPSDEFDSLCAEGQIRTSDRWQGYAFCRDGRVWSFKVGRWIKPFTMIKTNGRDQWYVSLDRKTLLLHRVLLEVFKGPCPDGMVGCHIDDIHCNNHIDNLKWATKQENVDDRKRNGYYAMGTNHHAAKVTEDQVREMRRLRSEGWILKDLGTRFGIHFSVVHDIVTRKTWSHVA